MEFELPKINVSFEYDKDKDEVVLVINGVEKRVKTEDIIKKLDKKQPRFIMHSDGSLEQIVEYCEDCISRQQAIDKMQELEDEDIEAYGCAIPEGFDGKRAIEALKTLPSIQPKPKTGHWKKLNVGYGCSECSLATNESGVDFYRFCPNCGAKMESEDKECPLKESQE